MQGFNGVGTPGPVSVTRVDGSEYVTEDEKDIWRDHYPKYSDYLKSEHWANIKKRYRKSKAPKECVVCGNKKYQLHHRTYKRIGHEHLGDFVALCGRCHHALHRQHKYMDESLWHFTNQFIKLKTKPKRYQKRKRKKKRK